jgi:hypothetical protein
MHNFENTIYCTFTSRFIWVFGGITKPILLSSLSCTIARPARRLLQKLAVKCVAHTAAAAAVEDQEPAAENSVTCDIGNPLPAASLV